MKYVIAEHVEAGDVLLGQLKVVTVTPLEGDKSIKFTLVALDGSLLDVTVKSTDIMPVRDEIDAPRNVRVEYRLRGFFHVYAVYVDDAPVDYWSEREHAEAQAAILRVTDKTPEKVREELVVAFDRKGWDSGS